MSDNQPKEAAKIEQAAAEADGLTVEQARERQFTPHHDDHGRTPANWTAAILVTLAFLVGTLGVVFAQPVVFWIGVALIPIALIAYKVLSGMGYGSSGHHES